MAVAAMVGALVGGGLQAQGQMKQAKAKFRNEVDAADAAETNAFLTRQQATEEERRSRIEGKKILGSQRAAYSASGVTMEGSPMEVLQESARNAEMDALTIRYAGDVRAKIFQREALAHRRQGQAAVDAARLGAWSTMFGAGAQAAGYGAS